MIPDAPQAMSADPHGTSSAGPSPAEQIFTVRPFRASDMAYVRDSWLRSTWDIENQRIKADGVGRDARVLAGHAWYALNRPEVTRLIESPEVAIHVAVSRDDDDHIAGWVAVKDGKRIWGAVKQAYRRDANGQSWGVAEMLARAAGLETE